MTLARRLWISLMAPVAVVLFVYGWFAHQNRHHALLGEARAEINNHAILVEAALETAVARGDLALVERKIERLSRADRILGVALFDREGHLLRATSDIATHSPELAKIARQALARDDLSERQLELQGAPVMVKAVKFSPHAAYAAVLVRDLKYLPLIARTLDRGLIISGAGILLLVAAIVGWAARATVGAPSGAIVAGAKRVAAGDLTAQVPEHGARELVELARAFNAMQAALSTAREELAARQAERLATERKLRQLQSLAAAGQVTASIGHEIGSPLNVILGRARRAMDHADCSDAIRKELDIIARQTERISGFVGRLLEVARSSPAHDEPADVVAATREVLEFLGPDCRRRGVETSLETPDVPVSTTLAPDELFQVLFNLCLNAVQAQPDGGGLIVRVLQPETERVVIEVEDRGPGIDGEVAAHIFDPFFTTKSQQGGTGLGLAIVSGIVRDAGGTVELASSGGAGTCFRVALPARSTIMR